MGTLPLELFRPILHQLKPGHLCGVARVSRQLQIEAESLIYHTLILKDPVTIIAICKRLSLSFRVASYVRAVCIEVPRPSPYAPLFTSFLRLLATVLERTTELQCLVLFLQQSFPSSWIFQRCSFKLRVFRIFLCTPDRLLYRFLETQDRLLRLEVFPPTPFIHLHAASHDFLPNLSVLEGDCRDTFALLPGRSITHLRIHNEFHIPSMANLAFSIGPIKFLNIHTTPFIPLHALSELPSLLTELESLWVATHVPPTIEDEDTFLDIMSAFKCIIVFEFYWPQEACDDVRRRLLKSLVDACPRLCSVTFYYDMKLEVPAGWIWDYQNPINGDDWAFRETTSQTTLWDRAVCTVDPF